MPDADKLTAALDEIRELVADQDKLIDRMKTENVDVHEFNATQDKMAARVPRLLAALDEVLKLHQPRQFHDMVESCDGRHLCAHSPDYDGDRHYEGDNGLWYCMDRPTVKVCASCADDAHDDLWAEWPCPTEQAISRALFGGIDDHPQ